MSSHERHQDAEPKPVINLAWSVLGHVNDATRRYIDDHAPFYSVAKMLNEILSLGGVVSPTSSTLEVLLQVFPSAIAKECQDILNDAPYPDEIRCLLLYLATEIGRLSAGFLMHRYESNPLPNIPDAQDKMAEISWVMLALNCPLSKIQWPK
jgi:hypothetical protein